MPALPGQTTNVNGIPGAANPAGSIGNANLIGQGGTGGFLSSLFGAVPGVANPIVSAQEATLGNRGDLTNVANLAYGADTIGAAGAALPFQNNLPGYESNLTQAAGNTASELAGQLPQDVVNQITQQAAERGVATGQAPGSPNENAQMLQSLGLNSLNLEQTGQSNLNQLIGDTPTGPQYNPSSAFVSPSDMQAAAQAANVASAAPDPGLDGIVSGLMTTLGGAGSAAGGGSC